MVKLDIIQPRLFILVILNIFSAKIENLVLGIIWSRQHVKSFTKNKQIVILKNIFIYSIHRLAKQF